MKEMLAVPAALAVVGLLVWKYGRERQLQEARHNDLLAGCMRLIEDARLIPETAGYARLEGRYRGLPVQVRPIVDTLSVRKLPSLWLLVTMPEPLPVRSTLDLLMRPDAADSFTNFHRLPVRIDTPPDFPARAVLRTDDPAAIPPPELLMEHLDPFFGPRAKELLISPRGLRIVWLADEGDRARYGVFRQAAFSGEPFDPAVLADLLDRLVRLREAILEWQAREVRA